MQLPAVLRTLPTRIKTAVSALGTGITERIAFGLVREPFSGAWQRNIQLATTAEIATSSAAYASIWRISSDIGKMRVKLIKPVENEKDIDVWEEIRAGSPFLPVLRKPNRYQTRQQFLEYWIVSKLVHGNAYILKERDARGVVQAFYPIDPRRVTPLITDDGGLYYGIRTDKTTHLEKDTFATVPASELIHDRMQPLFNMFMGVPPIVACAASSTQALRIQTYAEKFFANMSRPSGHLSAPGRITPETENRLKEQFERDFSGANLGRLLVTGDGIKYEPMTIPAEQAQLIEQLRWTVEDVARAFGMPLYKLGLGQPTNNNLAALNQDYYDQALHPHVEAIEALIAEALDLFKLGYEIELDTDNLLRMDPQTLMTVQKEGVGAGIVAPNEARNTLNKRGVKGGEEPVMQQQNWPLSVLALREPPTAKPGEKPTAPSDGGNSGGNSGGASETPPADMPDAPMMDALSDLAMRLKQAEPSWLTATRA